MLEKDFVPYEQALALKELGFNESCLGNFADDEKHTLFTNGNRPGKVDAPSFSQAFRWFREMYDLDIDISRNDQEMIDYVKSNGVIDLKKYRCGYSDGTFHAIKGCYSYEEAELACLTKLIEIVKNK